MGLRLRPPCGRRGRARRDVHLPARDWRDPGFDREWRGADGDALRALRRAAAGAARPLGVGSLRARDPRRLHLRARLGGRQGELVPAAEGGRASRRRGQAAGEGAHRLRRRGGDGRTLDRRVPRGRRARRRRLPHLRQRHAPRGRARIRPRHPRSPLLPRAPAKRGARSPLRHVRRSGAERRRTRL